MERINIKKIASKYVNKNIPVETSITNMMFIGCILGGAMCLIAAFLVHASWMPTTICACLMFFSLIIYAFAVKTNKFATCAKFAIIIVNFVFFPGIFYTSGGIRGGCLPYFILGIVFSFIIFSGISCWIVTISELIYLSAVILSTYKWPFLVITQAQSDAYTYSMLTLNLILASLFTGIIIRVLLNHNEQEIEKIDCTLNELEDLSIKDPLTKVYNRRYMLEFLQTNIDRSYNFGAQLSIVIFDIDHFKNLNDTYGHLVGDEILKNLCAVIGRKIRNSDIISRYGGEEFIAVFPNAAQEIAFNRAEEIRIKIEDSILSKEVVKTITVSGGVAEYIRGMSVEELIEVADKNLYNAKETGRNKVCMSTDDEIATLIKQEKMNV